jgi:CBS-domain-containing membrane protein
MLVKDVMTQAVRTCHATTSAGEAAAAMGVAAVGCLPVVDSHRQLIGIVTDRDVCMLVARHGDPWAVPVRDIMAGDVIACRTTDHLDVALVAMKENGLRRIPVLDARQQVRGLVSIDDVIRHTGGERGLLPAEAVLDVLRHICGPAALA